MKIDLTKLPVGEMVIVFLLGALAVTFFLAFDNVRAPEDEEPANAETPAPGTPLPDGEAITVIMGDNFFDPDSITVAAGQPAVFSIRNEGAAIHNMRIAGPDGEYNTGDDAVSDPQIVSGGEEATLVWEAPAEPQEIPFRCDFHPREQVGTISVQ
jgi:plastocyanin